MKNSYFRLLINQLACTVFFLLYSIEVNASSPRHVVALQAIESYSIALERYKDDHGEYPNSQEGLSALKPRPESAREVFQTGYVKRISKDPWGFNYRYVYPGEKNPFGFDLWTNGADGKIGGVGINADCGNWTDSRERCEAEHRARSAIEEVLFFAGSSAFAGLVIGAPIYLGGVYLRRREGKIKFVGWHLLVLLYLTVLGPIVVFSIHVFRSL